jgi:two-component system, NtrC family, nitrogen regulation response regulator GlnG
MPPRNTRDDTAVRRALTTKNQPPGMFHVGSHHNEPTADLSATPVPALTIVWHPRAHRAGERVLLYALSKGGEVQLSRNDLDFVPPGKSAGQSLDDPYISRKPIVLRASANGGVTVLTPADGTRVACGSTVVDRQIEIDPEQLERGVPLVLAGRVVVLLHLVEPSVLPTADLMGMAGDSTGIRRVRMHVQRVADLNIPVLIRGETGTGKELVARAIHEKSPRRTGPFVGVNLAAVPKDLATAELLGAAKGAFTGATRDREGYFQAARGGTLFLDELGEAPLDVQVMLLRVLETGEMYPVGASSPVPADVRLIAATDANLEAQIQEDRFKAPLLHRVSGYEIWIPPLRKRREDIGVLVYHFAKEELAAIGESHRLDSTDPYTEPWLPPALATLLVSYDWPGNIRQLRNVVRRIAIGSRGQATTALDPQLEAELSSSHAQPHSPQAAQAHAAPQAAAPAGPRRKPSDVSEAELVTALRANDWDLKAAADELGIPRPSIYDLIRRSPNIRKAGDLSSEEIVRCFHECEGDLDRMVMKLEVSKRALQRRLNELGLKVQ